jgi:hypothetical protein
MPFTATVRVVRVLRGPNGHDGCAPSGVTGPRAGGPLRRRLSGDRHEKGAGAVAGPSVTPPESGAPVQPDQKKPIGFSS